MWLVPSKDPEQLHNFFLYCRDAGLTSHGLVLVEKKHFETKKEQYLELLAPGGWNFHLTEADDVVGQVREVWDLYRQAPWIGLFGDDCVPLSTSWEQTLIRAINGCNVVSCHRDGKGDGIGRGCVWSGDMVRQAGALFFEGLSEDEQYEAWENIVSATHSKTNRGDVAVRRVGWVCDHQNGGEKVRAWLETEAPAICERIDVFKGTRGVRRMQFDFTGIKLMIAVPTVDGSLDHEFLACLNETYGMLNAVGAAHQFSLEPFNADITMARNKMFARFMRSDCSHVLMIDCDMGWKPEDVVRLFAAKKDFVAVAGPKKRVPLQCAVTPLPLDKNYGKINFDPESGTVEVKEVGGAFNLYSRAFGEKMIAAFPELEYAAFGGGSEYALFLPLITEKAYKAEDYAICHRWRQIDGEVFVCPDVSLQHTGRKVFEGAWTETWPKQPVPQVVKEAAE